MPDLTITNFSKDLQQRLSRRAARKGHSAQDEAREILREAVKDESNRKSPKNIAAAIRALVEPRGGYELDIPPRHPPSEPAPKPSNAGK